MVGKWMEGLLGGAEDPLELLADLSREKTPVRIEVENSPLRFDSQLSLKKGNVVIAKPLRVSQELTAGCFVRVRIPGKGKRQMRLEVTTPHFNLASGNAVFICKAPEGEVTSRRRDDRFDVRRFNNLNLILSNREFRLVDFSPQGFKVQLSSTVMQQEFPIGLNLRTAYLRMGPKAKVNFERVVPRTIINGTMVGCEFEVQQDGISEHNLTHLLNSLAKVQVGQSEA